MNLLLLDKIICPNTYSQLILTDYELLDNRIKSGKLLSKCGKYEYPIINFIPRFVKHENYTDSFGWQWNKFKNTQFDSNTRLPITFNRFWKATNWHSKIEKNEWILDAGCGSGRFADIASDTQANIVAIDYSSAVDACYDNLSHKSNITIIQCDIYFIPFKDNFFDKIYSLGVLQHTPDVKMAVESICKKLKHQGHICIDFYEKSIKSMLLPKYWIRPFTTQMNKERVFHIIEENVDRLLYLSQLLKKIPIFGNLISRLVPIADYSGILPLNKDQLREWAILDTFDWLTPTYDNPQRRNTISKWLIEFGFEQIEVIKEGHIVGRGVKK